MSDIGINSGISIVVVSYDGTRISRRIEKVPNDKIKFIRDAIGVMGIKESEYYAFVNYNYREILYRTDQVRPNDVIEFIDVEYIQLTEPELFTHEAQRDRTLGLEQRIDDASEATDDTVAYLEQKLAAVGVDEPSKTTAGRRSKGDPGDYVAPIEPIQVVSVSWDNIDRYVDFAPPFPSGTGPSDTATFNISFSTNDNEVFADDVVVTIDIDSGGMLTEGVGYTGVNLVKTIVAGTSPSSAGYVVTFQSYDDEGPADMTVTLTAVGATPIGTTTVTWLAVV